VTLQQDIGIPIGVNAMIRPSLFILDDKLPLWEPGVSELLKIGFADDLSMSSVVDFHLAVHDCASALG
jgi:hypothetical protein